jgi:putative phosphoesterase
MAHRFKDRGNYTVGVLSDTHGLIRPEVINVLKGSSLIIHAGDIGKPSILEKLHAIAPVIAVRGNMDADSWARRLPKTRVVEIGSVVLYVLHDITKLNPNPAKKNVSTVIYGHSHRPFKEERNGVLYVNPGSAGPRRFTLPVSVALIFIKGTSIDVQFVTLNV